MKYRRLIRLTTLSSFLLALAFTASPVNSSSPAPQSSSPAKSAASVPASPAAQKALGKLRRAGQAAITAQVSRKTGYYNFVRISDGDILATADNATTPAARAAAFLGAH
ncbi:MAG: hypothetical protein WAO00_12230, partial [Chthoniobacterales bacterium]